MSSRHATQRGAALLLAMIIVALIVTMAAGMVWMQSRAVSIEAAERARSQSAWILSGALDWSRLILREDQRGSRQRGNVYDALNEPWATPLAEARLSTFLAADKDNNTDSGPEAFISGSIVDAQSRFNIRGLIDPAGKPIALQVAALQRLANLAGAPSDAASRIADALARSYGPVGDEGPRGPPLRPTQLADLGWQGIDKATLARLQPYVDLLPLATPVNANTAPREVLVAAIDGLDPGTAERLVQARLRKPFESLGDIQALLPQNVRAEANRVGVSSNWFIVSGRLRLEDRVLEERSLLQRDSDKVTVRRRERINLTAGGAG
jgi:general secretion pathway protein K